MLTESRPGCREGLLPVSLAARRLGVPERTVRYWAQTGVLRAIKVGPKLWFFTPGEVDEFKGRRAVRAEQWG